MEKSIYPKVKIEQDNDGFSIETYIRVLSEDKIWHLCKVAIAPRVTKEEINLDLISEATNRFLEDVYHTQKLCMATDNLFDQDDKPVYEVDANQDSEEERLHKLIQDRFKY